MTRQEVLSQYKVDDHGIIRDPGKFEGEQLYVPYFWDAFMNGGADEDDGEVMSFDVGDEDRKEFPELVGVARVQLQESDTGFVYCTTEAV